MKYLCMGFWYPEQFEKMSESERHAFVDSCFTYDDILRKNGHFVSGEGLQGSDATTTLRWREGKVAVTDGPYTETKEQLGGFLILEARDLNHAIQLMSKHPGVRAGGWEIRPIADMTGMIQESAQRRAKRGHTTSS